MQCCCSVLRCALSLLGLVPEGFVAMHAGAAAKPKKVWEQRLTAATYRYFVRGTTEKPSKDDVKISQPGMRRLAPYDHMLRHFQCVSVAHPFTPNHILQL